VNRRKKLSGLAMAVSFSAVLFHSTPSFAADKVTVFAAASLKNALDAVAASWKADTQSEAAISYAASSALAKQIAEGAPADIFISADRDWMNKLAEEKLIAKGSIVYFLGNEIVLIAPKDSAASAKIENRFDLPGLLGEGKLAMGDVKAVPAGKYGKAALETLGLWAAVENNVAMAENVRAALKLVATGEAALGIVYATDAMAEPAVRVVGTFPPESHPPILYPLGLLATSTNPNAARFARYLQESKAQGIFREQGFTLLAPAAN
jgi:molybdate transport system substrate-binding protein